MKQCSHVGIERYKFEGAIYGNNCPLPIFAYEWTLISQ